MNTAKPTFSLWQHDISYQGISVSSWPATQQVVDRYLDCHHKLIDQREADNKKALEKFGPDEAGILNKTVREGVVDLMRLFKKHHSLPDHKNEEPRWIQNGCMRYGANLPYPMKLGLMCLQPGKDADATFLLDFGETHTLTMATLLGIEPVIRSCRIHCDLPLTDTNLINIDFSGWYNMMTATLKKNGFSLAHANANDWKMAFCEAQMDRQHEKLQDPFCFATHAFGLSLSIYFKGSSWRSYPASPEERVVVTPTTNDLVSFFLITMDIDWQAFVKNSYPKAKDVFAETRKGLLQAITGKQDELDWHR